MSDFVAVDATEGNQPEPVEMTVGEAVDNLIHMLNIVIKNLREIGKVLSASNSDSTSNSSGESSSDGPVVGAAAFTESSEVL